MKRKYTSLHSWVTGAIFLCAFAPFAPARAAIPEDKGAAVIFAYQRVGEDGMAGNISAEQFSEHIDELKKAGFSVLPLAKIVESVKGNEPLPAKAVAITFEAPSAETLENAAPLLEDARIPFTVFIASDTIDGDTASGHLSWDQVKSLHKNKLASLGLLPAAYDHMAGQPAEKNAEAINRAISKYRQMLGEDPVFFAYPYGETSAALKKQISTYKFKAAFGQQSGVVHQGSDLLALPRFTMTDDYGDLDRFLLAANALPLPVSDVVPGDSVITQNPPRIGFTVTPELKKTDKLSCFASDIGKLPLTRIDNNRIEIRLDQPLTDRRTRINCTLPGDVAAGDAPSWRWFGLLLTLAGADDEPVTKADVTDGSETSENTEQN